MPTVLRSFSTNRFKYFALIAVFIAGGCKPNPPNREPLNSEVTISEDTKAEEPPARQAAETSDPSISKPIPVKRITEAQRDHYLTVGGLPGNDLSRKVKCDTDEYNGLVNQMIKVLNQYGKVGLDDPYYIDLYATADYFPCVEVKDVEHVHLILISELHSELRSMPEEYRIDVCSAFPYWKDELNIFIEHEKVYWYSEDHTAEKIGLLNLDSLPPIKN